MALVNVHPDYMAFGGSPRGVDEYPAAIYEEFLIYLKERYEDQYYHCLPRELARYYLESVKSAEDHEKEVQENESR